jgi:Fe2+ or Zn2+ uptake regulation protein
VDGLQMKFNLKKRSCQQESSGKLSDDLPVPASEGERLALRLRMLAVYRNLQVLEEDGAIMELNLNGTVSRYEAKQKSHYHFRCEKCGRVSDIDMPLQLDLDQQAEKRTGLKISSHQLEFRGLCKECQNKK